MDCDEPARPLQPFKVDVWRRPRRSEVVPFSAWGSQPLTRWRTLLWGSASQSAQGWWAAHTGWAARWCASCPPAGLLPHCSSPAHTHTQTLMYANIFTTVKTLYITVMMIQRVVSKDQPVGLPPQIWGWNGSRPSVHIHYGPGSLVLLYRPGDGEKTLIAIILFHYLEAKDLDFPASPGTAGVFMTGSSKHYYYIWVSTLPAKHCQSSCWAPSVGAPGWWCCWSRRAAGPGCLPGSRPGPSLSASTWPEGNSSSRQSTGSAWQKEQRQDYKRNTWRWAGWKVEQAICHLKVLGMYEVIVQPEASDTFMETKNPKKWIHKDVKHYRIYF